MQSLERNSPNIIDGRKYHARTDWTIDWTFWWEQSSDGCSITRVKTDVDIAYTLPRLQTFDQLSVALQQEWLSYTKVLRCHEETHMTMVLTAADEIGLGIEGLSADDSCKRLEIRANDIAHNVIDELHNSMREYDCKTEHGIGQ